MTRSVDGSVFAAPGVAATLYSDGFAGGSTSEKRRGERADVDGELARRVCGVLAAEVREPTSPADEID